ncbi:hypothetical protein [Deinococcus geothermalis]|uniref:hypothetical protein n=1 Tax=Deinococcus geothermalis TaxID=68909 RepID=UPI002354D792|nr:hypothetical protein [Deinococcus geothermalis]
MTGSSFELPREEGSSIPKWVLAALPKLSNASDIKVLLFLAERARYRRSAFGPGEISDGTGLDYRTTTTSIRRLGELGYIISAGGVHVLRGACTRLAQPLHKSTPTPQAKNPVQGGKNQNVTSAKDSKGLRRTKKDSSNPPLPPQGAARESTAPVKAPTPFQETFEAVALVCYGGTEGMTTEAKSRTGKAAKSLTEAGYSAPDIPLIAAWIGKNEAWRRGPLAPQTLSERAPAWRQGVTGGKPKAHELDEQDWEQAARDADARNSGFLTEGGWN